MSQEKILIVEDDAEIRELIRLYLSKYEFETVVAGDGQEAIRRFEEDQPDLILLDVLLPMQNGTSVCQQIRQYSNTPIIFMSCKKDSEDIIQGLGMGADDYITKPFDPNVLVARIQANLRRAPIYRRTPNTEETNSVSHVLHYNELEINLNKFQVSLHGVPVNLSVKELMLLIHLAQHPNQLFTTEELYHQVWGTDSLGDTRTVMVHISNIRKKIEKDPSNPKFIQTVRGLGYMFKSVEEKTLVELAHQLEKENKVLSELAFQDGLTRIDNRRSFEIRLEKEWAESTQTGSPLSLLMLDIDFFKAYNDCYGHVKGDDCLKSVAGTLRDRLANDGGFLARYGGEEFAVILPGTDLKQAQQIASQITAAIYELEIPHPHSPISDRITASIGISSVSSLSEKSPVQLIKEADTALYHSKQDGRNRVRVFV